MTVSGVPAAPDVGNPDSGGISRTAPRRAHPIRATLALARIEAFMLVRSALVLGGLVAGAGLVWGVTEHTLPLWWDVGWRLGYGQMVLSTTVLVATQLAAGRVCRDGLQDLYASFPAPAGTRVRAQLLAALGALPAGLVLVAAAAAAFGWRGAIGTPSAAVLVAGVVLVVAGAAVGVAVGVRFPHPLAGVLAGLVWFGAFSQTNRFNGGVPWLFPWSFTGGLGSLPAPLAGYPPAAAHAVELGAVAVLAAAVALAVTAIRRRHRASLVGVGVLALAAACVAGAVQLQPVSTAALDRLAVQIAEPAAVQQCTSTDGVRYCVYPGFESLVPTFRGPVEGVLAKLPARPAQGLTVRQVADRMLTDPALTHGHTEQQVASWLTRMKTDPFVAPASGEIYPVVGQWPAGGALPAARFDVALGTAEWAVGLPTATGDVPNVGQCVPVGQAREAIAIWLAILATHPSSSTLQAGLPGSGPGHGSYESVGNTVVATWAYPGNFDGYVAAGPEFTVDGYLLARAMTALPAQHVQQVLAESWNRWRNPNTSAADLAAALGIAQPTFPVPSLIAQNPPPIPGRPVCT